jgi:hypothetical protein
MPGKLGFHPSLHKRPYSLEKIERVTYAASPSKRATQGQHLDLI